MEALYIKLYERYSKLKSSKENQIEQINQEQEVKFVEFVTAAETLIKHLTTENKRLSGKVDELRNEVVSLRKAKDQTINDFQERLMEEKQKNQQLSAEIEQLQNLQQERSCFSNISDHLEEQRLNSNSHSPSVSRRRPDESPPMKMTRKRARLSAETDPATNSPDAGLVHQSVHRELLTDQSKINVSNPECCQCIIVNGGPCQCLFQSLVECLTGMKVSIGDQPEGKCVRAVHQSSGYSFSLTWVNKSAANEGELLYHVASLGTFTNIAPEWMKEVIVFSMSMCPVFFERLSRVIKHH